MNIWLLNYSFIVIVKCIYIKKMAKIWPNNIVLKLISAVTQVLVQYSLCDISHSNS